MNAVKEFVGLLGIKAAHRRDALARQIESYAFALAVSRLSERGELTEADQVQWKRVCESHVLDDDAMRVIFGSEARKQELQKAIVDAMNLVREASQKV